MVGNKDAVAGKWLSIVAASVDHLANAGASAGDNYNGNEEANKLLPQAGMDADGVGR